MSRYDGPGTRALPNNNGFRVDKRTKPKARRGGRPIERQQKGKGAVANATASITQLKRRLRSLGRLLSNNEKLPADVRIGHEREIQALQHDLVSLMLDKAKHEMIGKYHKVRFFERQRATRILKKAVKALETCEDDGEQKILIRKVHVAEVDLNYPQYYPHMMPYQSLWKKEKGDDDEDKYTPNDEQEDGAKGNIEIWRQVEDAMAQGTLDKLKDVVNDAKMTKIRQDVESIHKLSTAKPKGRGQGRDEDAEPEDDDTGAAFFE